MIPKTRTLGELRLRKVNLLIKRTADILGSILGLAMISPLLLTVAIVIKVTMPGPVLFRQQRVGKNGKTFAIYKFRTMKVDREAEANFDSQKDQERLTPTGRFLRRIKLDELPQLYNVLCGDMSLVGPRPTIMQQVVEYTPRQRKRLAMRPGMTGLAQVNGNITLDWTQRIEYDIKYIEQFSIALDVAILLKTVLIVLLGEEKFRRESSLDSTVNHNLDIKA